MTEYVTGNYSDHKRIPDLCSMHPYMYLFNSPEIIEMMIQFAITRYCNKCDNDSRAENSILDYMIYGMVIFILVVLVLVASYCIISKNMVAKIFKKLKKTQQQMTKLELCVASESK